MRATTSLTIVPHIIASPLTVAETAERIDHTQPIQIDTKKENPFANGDSEIGTVGCMAVNGLLNLASVTSTGGLVNKMIGRIGDMPLIGVGPITILVLLFLLHEKVKQKYVELGKGCGCSHGV
ncbi:hypothetical protein VNO78_21749 [Psophocarpus tetragonolobus]|uniref:beta-aspartyl-peptidase n=1 Tax=Psophocarpus tetragonolobus TaxID=3891 RepID=A0AAN9SBK9_PSOTE